MIVCNKCGTREPDNSKFCSVCGAFLEFDGTHVHSEAPETPHETVDVGAVTPGDKEYVAPVIVQTKRTVAQGEQPCPARCGGSNPPGRNYCRYCAVPLHPKAAPVPVKVSWWRRLWRKLFGRKVYAANERRRAPRPPWRLKKRWIALVLAVLLGSMFSAQLRAGAKWVETEVRDGLQAPAPITPTALRASTVLGGNTAERIADRDRQRFWAPRGNPAGSWIEMDLPRAIRLLSVIITPGQSDDAIKFQAQGRPAEVDVTMIAQDQSSTTKRVAVLDRPGPQTFTVKANNVIKIRLTFVSAHGMKPNSFMALAEVELFGR